MPLRGFLQRFNLNSYPVPPEIYTLPVKGKRLVYSLVHKVVTDHDGTNFLEVKWAVYGLFYRGSHLHSQSDMEHIDKVNVFPTKVSVFANTDGTYVTPENDHQYIYL